MRITHTRSAAALTAIAAGSLAIYSLRPADKPVATLAARTPAVEYRTQVIRRTVHVVRHERPAHPPMPRHAVATGGRGPTAGRSGARTSASGSHPHSYASPGTSAAPGAVATRTSGASHGSAGAAVPSTGASQPVATRTSGATHAGSSAPHSSSGGSRRVATRTSGGAANHSSGSSGSGSGSHVTTRTSGGGGEREHHGRGDD